MLHAVVRIAWGWSRFTSCHRRKVCSFNDTSGETDITLFRHSLRVLIFNCTSGRSGETFLAVIKEAIVSQFPLKSDSVFFDHVIFCTNVTYANGNSKGGAWQGALLVFTLL